MKREYEDLNVTSVNREAAHSPWGAYETEEQALSGGLSRRCIPLDGVWDFKYLPGPYICAC